MTTPIAGDYVFDMDTKLDYKDKAPWEWMVGKWKGTFTINSNGEITGEGTFTYKAEVFDVDDNKCGYKWGETGDGTFSFGGAIRLDRDSIPVKIVSPKIKSSQTGGAYATCSDPGKWRLEAQYSYVPVHINALVGLSTSGLHTTLGRQLKADKRLIAKVGITDYNILVTAPIELVPLSD